MLKQRVSNYMHRARIVCIGITALQLCFGGTLAPPAFAQEEGGRTLTPIKHVIVIVGENRTFDHIFATYKPVAGETVDNLLSKHIVKADGTPGENFSLARQYEADVTGADTFQMSPTTNKKPYSFVREQEEEMRGNPMPAPLNGGPTDVCTDNFKLPSNCTADPSALALAKASEDGLPDDFYQFMLTGGSGLSGKVPDSRIAGVHNDPPYSTLAPGPFQLTRNHETFPYDSYAASPVHRFYQMWQQEDCNAAHATSQNPSGCMADLFAWTETTVGAGTNGLSQALNFSADYAPGKKTTGEGSTAMGFYNVQQGDAAYTKFLADHYAMSDNYHQPVMGGTGFDEIMLFFGDALWFSDSNGNALTPPHNELVWPGTNNAGVVDEIENPDPQPGTNNWWVEDGYGGGAFGSSSFGGGSYSNCSDPAQPGVGPILAYLDSIHIKSNCEEGHYYLLNNYNPGYFGDGSDAYADHNDNNTPFTIPGTTQHSIGDVLLANHVSWKSYSDQWTPYLTDPYQLNYGTPGAASDQYCNICNGFQYQKQIMTDATNRAHLVDTTELYTDIANGTLPAVSFVKPSGWVDGHPASSKWNLYEGFVKKIIDAVQANPELWASTAILVTTDEGGGYYDSGYVQILDFFGDGTRIPMIAVSPYTKPGHISHSYADHVSVLKFIEHNWFLEPISGRSRDNLPNPVATAENPYVPTNRPAISDLMDLFSFPSPVASPDN